MTESTQHRTSTREVAIYIGYLASFMVLLAAAGLLFGMNVIYVVFQFFIVAALGSVAVASRIMG